MNPNAEDRTQQFLENLDAGRMVEAGDWMRMPTGPSWSASSGCTPSVK